MPLPRVTPVSEGGTNATTLTGYVKGNGTSAMTAAATIPYADLTGVQASDTDLDALAALSSTGLIARTGSGTAATRTITPGSSKITVADGNGVAANPTIDVAEAALNLANLSGTLPISNGGTGQVTNTAAFGALSPITTKGDLVTYSTNNTRLPVGFDTQVLTSDSSTATGLKWNTPTVSFSNVTGKPTTLAGYGITDAAALSGATYTGDVKLGVAGNGLYIKEGTNATMGIATLVGGTVTVNTTKVTANSRIFISIQGGTLTNLGVHYISARTAGTSFTISSVNILDASDVAWHIIEPA